MLDFVGFVFGNVNSDGELERCTAQLSDVFSEV